MPLYYSLFIFYYLFSHIKSRKSQEIKNYEFRIKN